MAMSTADRVKAATERARAKNNISSDQVVTSASIEAGGSTYNKNRPAAPKSPTSINNPASRIIPHAEVKPAPAYRPTTGVEYLSGAQFGRKQSMHPGGGGRTFMPTNSNNEANTIPGGPFTSKRTPKSGYIPGGGNTVASGRFGTPSMTRPTVQSSGNPWGDPASSFYDSGSPAKKVRGNPKPVGGSAPVAKAKGGLRSAVRQKVSAGKSKVGKAIIPRPSRHAGKNAANLRAQTGVNN